MNSARAGRVGITVQRSRKSCGSWSITVDNSAVVNIAVTHTGDALDDLGATSAEQPDDYAQ